MREKLPKKWCVKADNTKIVQEYFLKMPKASYDYVSHKNYEGRYFNFPMLVDGVYSSNCVYENYIEITIQEFKKLVLDIVENDPIPEFLN